MSLENESVDIKAFTQRQRENFVLIFTKCLRGGGGGWGGRGESINFIRNNNQRKTKRHNCASSHHSLNLRYNVKRPQLKQRLKKGGGGESGVASSSLLHNPSDQYFFALSALNIEALHYREGYQSCLSS